MRKEDERDLRQKEPERNPRRNPEVSLAVAVITRAIDDAFYSGKNPNLISYKNDAISWIFDEEESRYSFLWISNILEIDVVALRQHVLSRVYIP